MRADDLVILLELARSGTMSATAAAMGSTHSTISRRIDALEAAAGSPVVSRTATGCHLTELGRSMLPAAEAVERAVGSARRAGTAISESESLSGLVRISAPEAFAACFAAPALARLHAEHPEVSVELSTATRPIVHGSGADVEVGVGDPLSPRVTAIEIAPYELGLYASRSYLNGAGTPRSTDALADHSLIYYIEGSLRVADLQLVNRLFTRRSVQVGSTSVFSQLEAARAGAGIALLPTFLARRSEDLVRVLRRQVSVELKFVAALATPQLRRAPALAALAAIRSEVRGRAHELTH